MGYQVYEINHRWCGYGVPAVCDHPDCVEEIDRGLAYVCGGEPGETEGGCGLYFCDEHMILTVDLLQPDKVFPQQCERCSDGEPPFDPKPDTVEWVTHMLTDESWEQWRTENPEHVVTMKERIT